MRSSMSIPCAALAASCVVAAVRADVPVLFNQGEPAVTGRGAVLGLTDTGGVVYANAFEQMAILNFNEFDPATLLARSSRSGTTGGGIGGPPVALAFSTSTIETSTSLAEMVTIFGSANSFGYLPAAGPNDSGTGFGIAHSEFSFALTAPVLAHWSFAGTGSLSLNGTPLVLSSGSTVLLAPGVYTAAADVRGDVSVARGGPGDDFNVTSSFTLQIGVPTPATAVILGLGGLFAARRRR